MVTSMMLIACAADQHLESSTKRTLVENETMVAELAYHTAQVGVSLRAQKTSCAPITADNGTSYLAHGGCIAAHTLSHTSAPGSHLALALAACVMHHT